MNISLGLIPIRYNLIVFLTKKLYLLKILRASCAKRGGRLEIEIERAFRNAQYRPDQTFGQIAGHYITLHLNYLPFLARVPWLWLCAELLSLSLTLFALLYVCAHDCWYIREKCSGTYIHMYTYIHMCEKIKDGTYTGTGTSTHIRKQTPCLHNSNWKYFQEIMPLNSTMAMCFALYSHTNTLSNIFRQ